MPIRSTMKVSRRDALKILGAVAGGAAMANIPSKWTKPDLTVGVLPAHAQTSSGSSIQAGVSDPAANFCFDLISTATISPPKSGVVLHYVITTGGIVVISSPALTGTMPTDASGLASLSITVNTGLPFNTGDTVTVTWSFENASDGIGQSSQVFTSAGNGC